MPVFHCPVCPKIFEERTEVEHHLEEEHPSRAGAEAELAAQAATAVQELDWYRVRALQSVGTGIAITIVMATTPSGSMTGLDVARLRRLANQARQRLACEPTVVPTNLEPRMARAVAAAEGSPTQEGLALLVDAHKMAIFHLPFEPVDRVVIDPSFATRDLETALRCYPLYRLVTLSRRPRLFEGRGAHLAEVGGDQHIAAQSPPAQGRDGKRAIRPERWILNRAHRQAGVRAADQMIAERIQVRGELPLVIAGDGRWRAEFRRQSPHAASVIAEIPGVRTYEPGSRLAELAEPHLARRLRDEQAAAVAELEQADGHGSVVWGPQAAWVAVHERAADAVWVEQGYAPAGRPSSDSARVELEDSPERPGIVDDLVDDLIEAARARQVQVHLLAPGTTGRPEPVAARFGRGRAVQGR